MVICLIYSRVCVLNPTWFIPPRHVSPLVTISLFLNSVSLFLFCKSMCVCVHACILSCFSHIRLCVTPWNGVHHALLSIRMSRQENEWIAMLLPGESSQTREVIHCLAHLLHRHASFLPLASPGNVCVKLEVIICSSKLMEKVTY